MPLEKEHSELVSSLKTNLKIVIESYYFRHNLRMLVIFRKLTLTTTTTSF